MSKENIRYQRASANQKAKLVQFVQDYFLPEEPICASIGLSKNDAAPMSDTVAEICVVSQSALSFVAMNGKNEIVGVRLSAIVDLDEERRKTSDAPPGVENFSKNLLTVLNFAWQLEDGYLETLKGTRAYRVCSNKPITLIRPALKVRA